MEQETKGLIRVVVVEDSLSACKVLANLLNADPQIIVVGFAHNGREAVEIIPRLNPDVVTMDINMPVMDGLETIKWLMGNNPLPILVVSTSGLKTEKEKVIKSIAFGALDIFSKDVRDSIMDEPSRRELIEKIKLLSRITVIRHPLARLEKKGWEILEIEEAAVPQKEMPDKIVGIVASTGGPPALFAILKSLPAGFPCGIVIVQHIVSGFIKSLAGWLDKECQIQVKVAMDAEKVLPGVAYFAPSDLHMGVKNGGIISLSNEQPYNGHRPSGDILLGSIAETYKEGAIGIILTGMGKDGVYGLGAVQKAGGHTIAQDEASCVVYGMPKAAIEEGTAGKVLPLDKIAAEIVDILSR